MILEGDYWISETRGSIMKNFNIVYFLNRQYEKGIQLYGRYLINRRKNNITIHKNPEFCNIYEISNNKSSSIVSCHSIVGNNGVGKTCLLYLLIDLIDNFEAFCKSEKFLLIYEYNDELYLFKKYNYTITYNDGNVNDVDEGKLMKHLNTVQSVYLQNNLSFNDSIYKKHGCMDFSVGHLIHKYTSDIISQHYASNEFSAIMPNYYFCENLKIVNFLYGIQSKKIKFLSEISDNLPRKLEIKFRNSSDFERYIKKEVSRQENDELFSRLAKVLENLRKVNRNRWKDALSYCLLWNYICCRLVPDTTPWTKPIGFKDSILRLENMFDQVEDKCNDEGWSFATAVANYFKQESSLYNECKPFFMFLQWYMVMEEKLIAYEEPYWVTPFLKIPVESDTKEFVEGIFRNYKKAMFEFPFLEFSFGCSSGEYYVLSLFANLYSLIAPDTVVFSYGKLTPKELPNLYLFFDEAEISMHPEWQRRFMLWIIDFCKTIFAGFHVHIIVATHSPILLSDFPSFSVTYLSRDDKDMVYGEIDLYKKTFAREIHMLYLDSFNLNNKGIIGLFAEQLITQLCKRLKNKVASNQEINKYDMIINQIGDELIHKRLKVMYEQSNPLPKQEDKKLPTEGYVTDIIQQLKEQRNALDVMIKNLEGTGNDKD